MLYYLFDYLDRAYDLPGAGLFQYITFRAAMAVILSLTIATVYGKKIIAYLQRKQDKSRRVVVVRTWCEWWSMNG